MPMEVVWNALEVGWNAQEVGWNAHDTDSPLMTWGEVESTPYRLQGCDTPLHAISGPGFTIKVIV
jgi:hypothetical protein